MIPRNRLLPLLYPALLGYNYVEAGHPKYTFKKSELKLQDSSNTFSKDCPDFFASSNVSASADYVGYWPFTSVAQVPVSQLTIPHLPEDRFYERQKIFLTADLALQYSK